jgi:hypothetical protein
MKNGFYYASIDRVEGGTVERIIYVYDNKIWLFGCQHYIPIHNGKTPTWMEILGPVPHHLP